MKITITLIISILTTAISVSDIYSQNSQNPSEVFIQQANLEHNEAVLQFTGDFTTAFSNQMGLESFDQYYSDTNVAIVNQFGDNNISTLVQNGIGNMAHIDQDGYKNAVNYLEG